MDYEVFELGDFVLQSGMRIPDARLAYVTLGTLNADKSNAILYPTWYSGQHTDNLWLIGEGMALDYDQLLAKQGIELPGERLHLLPHKHGTDGFFAAVLEKKS